MKDLDALKNQLARDGRLQRLQEIADSTDGQKLAVEKFSKKDDDDE